MAPVLRGREMSDSRLWSITLIRWFSCQDNFTTIDLHILVGTRSLGAGDFSAATAAAQGVKHRVYFLTTKLIQRRKETKNKLRNQGNNDQAPH